METYLSFSNSTQGSLTYRQCMTSFTKIVIHYYRQLINPSKDNQYVGTYVKSGIILLLSGSMSKIAISSSSLQREEVCRSRNLFLRLESFIQSCRRGLDVLKMVGFIWDLVRGFVKSRVAESVSVK